MDTPLIRTLYALFCVLIKGIWQYSIWIVLWVVWANECRDDTWPAVGTKCPFICWHPFPPLWSSVIQSHTHLDTSVEDKINNVTTYFNIYHYFLDSLADFMTLLLLHWTGIEMTMNFDQRFSSRVFYLVSSKQFYFCCFSFFVSALV